MKSRLKPGAVRSLEPFALFFISIAIGQIVARIMTGGTHVVTPATIRLLMWFWALGAAGALAYSLVVLRYMLKGNLANRVLYVTNALLYVALIVTTPLVKHFGPQHS